MLRPKLLLLSFAALSLPPLLAGCPPPDEATSPVCDGQPIIIATLIGHPSAPGPPTICDPIVLQYSVQYPSLSTVTVDALVERIEVRDSNDNLVFTTDVVASQGAKSVGLTGSGLPAGEYMVTLTLDADVGLTSCLAIYFVTTMTESFTVVEPPRNQPC